MPPQPLPSQGLRVLEPEYLPLKAYQSGGFYWDPEAQQLIRSVLGEFLPPLDQGREGGHRTGLFHVAEGQRELLWNSRQVSSRHRVPARQLRRLSERLDRFKQKAGAAETTPTNRWIIEQFRLPDFAREPELYRLSGPFWNRRLHVLWGCERFAESSLPPAAALPKLPAARGARWQLWLGALALLLLLLWAFWPFTLRSAARHASPKTLPVPHQGGSAPKETNASPGSISAAQEEKAADRRPALNAPAAGLATNAQALASAGLPAASAPQPAGGPASGGLPLGSKSSGSERPAPSSLGGQGGGQQAPSSASPAPAPAGNKNSPATAPAVPAPGGFEIQKQSDRMLPDGTMEVHLAVRSRSGQTGVPAVDFWEIDGVRASGGAEFAGKLPAGRHVVKARLHQPSGAVADLSASLTVALRQEGTVTLEHAE